jgi:hypothetical protein
MSTEKLKLEEALNSFGNSDSTSSLFVSFIYKL